MQAVRPALLAVAFLAGIIVADRMDPGATAIVLAGIAGAMAATYAWVAHRRNRTPDAGELLPGLSVTSASLLVIAALAIGFADHGANDFVRRQATIADGTAKLIRGRVVSEPLRMRGGSAFLVEVGGHRIWMRSYTGEAPSLGDLVGTEGRVDPLDPEDRFESSLYRRGAVGKTAVNEVRVEERNSNPFLRASTALRDRMRKALASDLPRGEAGLVLGMTIGDESLISDESREDFRATGLSHLTAVSGTNVALVLGSMLFLLRMIGFRRTAQVFVGILVVCFFAVVTRWEPSVLRATVMACLALSGFLFGRLYDAVHGLALAFVGILAFDTDLAWSIGFQLSFLASLGILLLAPPISKALSVLPRGMAQAISVALGAQAAVTPALAFHFGRVSLASVPANLVAFPLVAPVTIFGFLGSLMSTVWAPLGSPVIAVAGLAARALGAVATWFAQAPGATVSIPPIGMISLVVMYAVLIAAALLIGGKPRFAMRVVLAAGLLAFLSPAVIADPIGPAGMRMTFFDVGQGDAALIETARGARVIVDGGPDPTYLAATLQKRGIDRIDLLIASHNHRDHVAGLPRVAESVQVRTALDPGIRGRSVALPGGRGWEAASEGSLLQIGDLRMSVLGPAEELRHAAEFEAGEAEGSGLNDGSVVVRVEWGAQCALFTGDLEEVGQAVVAARHPEEISCTIMKAPHHGSPRLDEKFVKTADPEWVVISVGRNDYGHPSPKALEIFQRAGARVLRTDRLDDVVLEVAQDGRVRLTG